ncbi:MAG: hypothetical protein ABSB63_09060 [Spirochaetia bacterium]|jgi:hypothetical protein
MLVNPYDQLDERGGKWLRANFHAHAGTAGEICSIGEVISTYKEAGYGILMISNQNVLSDTHSLETAFGMVLINGFEYVEKEDMLCIGVDELLRGDHQTVIYECRRRDALVVLAHPNWKRKGYWPMQEMCSLRGYHGIEIYNGAIFRLDGSGLATDAWDELLSRGKLCWGFANDDFHRWFDIARGWNMVFVGATNQVAVKSSLRQGSFYASTGLKLASLQLRDELVEVQVDSRHTYVKDYTFRFIGRSGTVLSENRGERGTYRLTGRELYVRVEASSEHGAMLWTQPLYDSAMIARFDEM